MYRKLKGKDPDMAYSDVWVWWGAGVFINWRTGTMADIRYNKNGRLSRHGVFGEEDVRASYEHWAIENVLMKE